MPTMPSQGRRSRSTTSASTKASQRPLSRASTTSLQSQTTQDQHSNDFAAQYQQHPLQHSQHMAHPSQSHMQYAPVEQGLLQATHSLSHQDNMMMMQYQQHPAPQMMSQHSQEGSYSHPPPNAYMHLQQQAADYSNGNPQAAASGAETDDKKKKGASASATNDKELREMLTRADGRSLKDVADEVLRTERTSRAEKSKQLFAMLW